MRNLQYVCECYMATHADFMMDANEYDSLRLWLEKNRNIENDDYPNSPYGIISKTCPDKDDYMVGRKVIQETATLLLTEVG